MQSSPIVQPIPSTAASTVHLFPIELWDPIVRGMNLVVSFNMWHGRSMDPSPTKVYFWIWTGAKSALIVTLCAIKHLPNGISRDDGIWMVDERLMMFLVEVKMNSSVLKGTSGLYILKNFRSSLILDVLSQAAARNDGPFNFSISALRVHRCRHNQWLVEPFNQLNVEENSLP